MRMVLLGLVAAFVATIVAARVAFEATTAPGAGPVHEPWAQNKMEFVAWNGERWTAWIRDGEFELVPQDTTNWSRHANTTIAFIGWQGEPWQARIDGDAFVLAHRGDWDAETQPAAAVRYRDWSGNNQLRTAAQLTR